MSHLRGQGRGWLIAGVELTLTPCEAIIARSPGDKEWTKKLKAGKPKDRSTGDRQWQLNPRGYKARRGSLSLREFFRRRSEALMSSPVNKAQHEHYSYIKPSWSNFKMSSMQQRKNEILAKKAKLAELKKQRELRQREFTSNRNSVGDASEVQYRAQWSYKQRNV